ncbi:MAG: hypothetical protein Kow0081_4640 [Candidatus Dojkabacteria bacterium]
MKSLELLKNNTVLAYNVLDKIEPSVEKFQLILQLMDNLKALRAEMSLEDYNAEFNEIEQDVQNRVEKLTDAQFVNQLLASLKKIIGGI